MRPQDDAHLLPHSDTERKLLFCPAHINLIDPRDFNYWKETLEQRVYLFIYFAHHMAITLVERQTFQSHKAVAAKLMWVYVWVSGSTSSSKT